jgi:hypothetical protein
MSNLAMTWRLLGYKVRALLMLRKSFQLQRDILGITHPDTAESLECLKAWGWELD